MSKRTLDVLGISTILPLDLTYRVARGVTQAQVRKTFAALDLPLSSEVPDVELEFSTFHQASGGKVANALAFLGFSGRSVAAWGAIGDDETGRRVLRDLRSFDIDTDRIRAVPNGRTRLVFIAASTGWKRSIQVHPKFEKRVTFASARSPRPEPAPRFVVANRSNKRVARLIDDLRTLRGGTHIVFSYQISTVAWRKAGRAIFDDVLSRADIILSKREHLRAIVGPSATRSPSGGSDPGGRPYDQDLRLLRAVAASTGARLVIAHDGPERVSAWLRPEQSAPERTEPGTSDAGAKDTAASEPTEPPSDTPWTRGQASAFERILRPVPSPDIEISEPTGVRDVFHGAVIDMLLRVMRPQQGESGEQTVARCFRPDVIRAAISYANECSIYVGQGIGARNFPTQARRQMLMERYWASLDVTHKCFISYASEDQAFIRQVDAALGDRPGIQTWKDYDNLPAGRDLRENVKKAIDSTNVFVIFLSRSSIAKEWVIQECRWAQEARKAGRTTIVPVELERGLFDGSVERPPGVADVSMKELYDDFRQGILDPSGRLFESLVNSILDAAPLTSIGQGVDQDE